MNPNNMQLWPEIPVMSVEYPHSCFMITPFTTIWWFPKIGVPPNHPFIDKFSIINPPAIGVAPF